MSQGNSGERYNAVQDGAEVVDQHIRKIYFELLTVRLNNGRWSQDKEREWQTVRCQLHSLTKSVEELGRDVIAAELEKYLELTTRAYETTARLRTSLHPGKKTERKALFQQLLRLDEQIRDLRGWLADLDMQPPR